MKQFFGVRKKRKDHPNRNYRIYRVQWWCEWLNCVWGGSWEWEYGLVRSWVEQARGWKDSEARLLDVDRRVNRIIVGPWTKDEFNEKYSALWSRNSGTRSQAGTGTSWLFCFSSVPFWLEGMQQGDIRFLVEVFVFTHLTLLISACAHRTVNQLVGKS